MTEAGKRVYSRDGKHVGLTTGATRRCQMEGCTGRRIMVRWEARGRKPRCTYPCSKGMDFKGGAWRIL